MSQPRADRDRGARAPPSNHRSRGHLSRPQGVLPLTFKSRIVFVGGSAAVRFEYQIRNTRAAVHPGGLWDLGIQARGSSRPSRSPSTRVVLWKRCVGTQTPAGRNRSSQPKPRGRSIRTRAAERIGTRPIMSISGVSRRSLFAAIGLQAAPVAGMPSQQAKRATPGLTVASREAWVAATIKDFWQNFPKALRWQEGRSDVDLFPGEARERFELQGGEQKRHACCSTSARLTPDCRGSALASIRWSACVDPAWIEASEPLRGSPRASQARRRRLLGYVNADHRRPACLHRQARDHRRVRLAQLRRGLRRPRGGAPRGPRPFVSHYNNQYDFVYGAFLHLLRTGDARWRS